VAYSNAAQGDEIVEREAGRPIVFYRILTLFVIAIASLCASRHPTHAQSKASGLLVAPSQITLYIHSDLKDTAFVEPLVCSLRRVLAADVDWKEISLPLNRSLLASPTQFDVSKISEQFVQATAADTGSSTYRYLIIPYDLKDQTFHFVFATSFPRDHDGVLSTARLGVNDPGMSAAERGEATALRLYKLILKSVARLAGYGSSNGCILAFPRTLEELDRKPAEFCPVDRAALIDAGVLKEEESIGCAYVSQRQVNENMSVAHR
jgi:predicted Zn-dependent protease